jgi:hypothetical protein
MEDLIVVSTGSSILKYKTQLKEWSKEYDILAWSFAFEFLYGIYTIPKYFSFIDPHSAICSLKKVTPKTQVLVFDQIVNRSYARQQEYIGTSQMMDKNWSDDKKEKVYKQYLDSLNSNNLTIIPCTTIKKLRKAGSKLDWDNKDAHLRFKDKVVMGMADRGGKIDVHTQYMNLYENKLTMCVLPLCAFLKYKNIHLLGFDGKGGRFFNPNQQNGLSDMIRTYSAYMSYWTDTWASTHNMNIFTINNENESILTDVLPLSPLRE